MQSARFPTPRLQETIKQSLQSNRILPYERARKQSSPFAPRSEVYGNGDDGKNAHSGETAGTEQRALAVCFAPTLSARKHACRARAAAYEIDLVDFGPCDFKKPGRADERQDMGGKRSRGVRTGHHGLSEVQHRLRMVMMFSRPP